MGSPRAYQAEQRLKTEMERVDVKMASLAPPLFRDCAQRYLKQSSDLRSLEAIYIHLRQLEPYIGHLPPHQVHDATLASFISARIAQRASATTINRSLEVVARSCIARRARTEMSTGVPG